MAVENQPAQSGWRPRWRRIDKKIDDVISPRAGRLWATECVLQMVGLVLLTIVLVWGLVGTWGATQTPNMCVQQDRGVHWYNVGWVLAVTTLAGFVVGRGVASVRSRIRAALRDTADFHALSPAPRWLSGVFAAFLIVVTLLLAYETRAVLPQSGVYPITSYVRCAASLPTPLAAIGAAMVGFLVANWFWYPGK